jgi:hypothetical protein
VLESLAGPPVLISGNVGRVGIVASVSRRNCPCEAGEQVSLLIGTDECPSTFDATMTSAPEASRSDAAPWRRRIETRVDALVRPGQFVGTLLHHIERHAARPVGVASVPAAVTASQTPALP